VLDADIAAGEEVKKAVQQFKTGEKGR